MQRVAKLWQGELYNECGAECSLITDTQVSVNIAVATVDLKLNWTTDESYVLDIATNGCFYILFLKKVNFLLDKKVLVKIRARTVFGARHGLETLSQLITGYDSPPGSLGYRQRALVIVSQAYVSDSPVFPHRGLLLDTARNYLPLSAILRTIDGMAHVKLNVLHWHATDTQSFPLYLPRVPQLALYV